MVTTPPASPRPIDGHLSLLGPSPDDLALARLWLRIDQVRHLTLQAACGEAAVVVTNEKTGARSTEPER